MNGLARDITCLHRNIVHRVGIMKRFNRSILVKLIFTFIMLAGRLEFYPLLALFVLSFWKK